MIIAVIIEIANVCKMRWMDVNCWQSYSGSEKGHIARGNSIALYG